MSAELRGGAVRARLTLSLHAGSPLLRCTLDLTNQASDHRLRLRLPFGAKDGVAVAGGPFGPVRRERRDLDATAYPRETPVATAPAQRFAAAGAGGNALALLAPGFFEHELEPGGDLLLTLLRCVGQLSREDLPTRPGNAGWPTPTPGAQCHGRERIQLALAPVSTVELERVTPVVRLWEDAFTPPRAIWIRQATALDLPDVGLRLEGEGLVFSALKPAERGGIAFRCYNATGEPVEGRLVSVRRMKSVRRTRADEREGEVLTLQDGGRAVQFGAAPHEIVTFVVR
jgi:alpha-mannosidase